MKDAVKDAGSTIKDKVSGAADDAEDAAKSTSAYLVLRYGCSFVRVHRVLLFATRSVSAYASFAFGAGNKAQNAADDIGGKAKSAGKDLKGDAENAADKAGSKAESAKVGRCSTHWSTPMPVDVQLK